MSETLYGMEGWETLEDSLEGTVERHLEDVIDPDKTFRDYPETFPLRVLVFRRVDVPARTWERMAENALENILCDLDEDFGGEDETKPTPSMTAAAQAFVDVIKREYRPWVCEPTGEVVEVTLAQAMEMFE